MKRTFWNKFTNVQTNRKKLAEVWFEVLRSAITEEGELTIYHSARCNDVIIVQLFQNYTSRCVFGHSEKEARALLA